MNQRILDVESYDFNNSTIIKPPSTNFDVNDRRNRRYTRVVVDSRDRDITLYPSPSSYVINLQDEIQDVVAADLQVADIPIKAPIIRDKMNNSIIFRIDGVDVQVTIPSGDYNGGQNVANVLASTALASVTSTTTATIFTGSYDSNTDKFTFTSDKPIVIDLSAVTSTRQPSLAKLLGFQYGKTYTSIVNATTSMYELTAPYRKNIDEFRYAILHIDNLTVNTSTTSVLNKSFALLGPVQGLLTQKVDVPFRKDLNPPIAKLTKLRINFYDYFGQPFDFQNHDHRLEIIFESYKQLRKYQSYIPN